MSGSPCGCEFGSGGGSTKMISDGSSDANRKVFVEGVEENLLPTAQARTLWRPGPPRATPGTGNSHIDLPCHLSPGPALVAQLPDLLGGGGMSGEPPRTHGDAGLLKLLADRAPMNAQLGTDLAQGSTLGVQVGCTLNIHGRHRNESQRLHCRWQRMLVRCSCIVRASFVACAGS